MIRFWFFPHVLPSQWVSTPMLLPWPSCVESCVPLGTDSSWTDTRESLELLVTHRPRLNKTWFWKQLRQPSSLLDLSSRFRRNRAGGGPALLLPVSVLDLAAVFALLCLRLHSSPLAPVPHLRPTGPQSLLPLRRKRSFHQHRVSGDHTHKHTEGISYYE